MTSQRSYQEVVRVYTSQLRNLLGVLVYTVYSGYDHIRDGRIVLNEHFSFTIPNRVIGVREVVQQALGIVEPLA